MSLNQYSKEQLQEMSLIEIAYEYLKNSTQAVAFNQLIGEIAAALELSDEVVKSRIAQFYTDLNIDGRFLAVGENRWGLRVWYPVDTVEEEVVITVKAKKKKAKKVVDEDDLELDDFDEVDEDLEYEELDLLDEDDDDVVEDDFDELDVDDDFEEEDEVVEDAEEFEDLDDELEEDLDESLEEDLDKDLVEDLDEDLEEEED
ncbi:MAG: DNA-directed RNA polymerase subunit delta [Bacillota bacterium]|nr:DNA-directed RNA polymerase subunit delta [Bacillota bacterium]